MELAVKLKFGTAKSNRAVATDLMGLVISPSLTSLPHAQYPLASLVKLQAAMVPVTTYVFFSLILRMGKLADGFKSPVGCAN